VLRVIVIVFLVNFILNIPLQAQVEKPVRAPQGPLPVKADTIPNKKDTLSVIRKSDTLSKTPNDSTPKPAKGDIETTILYSAKDSILSNLNTKMMWLYGEAKVKYGDIELQAEEIVIDYENATITARSMKDSSGRSYGYPIFINGSEKYETKDMVYNFKTKKAKITEVVTKQGDGFLHGNMVYKNEKNELFSIGNAYTTCDLAEPHFRIVSKRTKAIPNDKMVSGPFYFEFNGVPTPLGFAFGIFPAPKKSASGILVPTYGEERRRGFFLRRGGYFFDISEYMKLTLTADIYSKGGSAINASTNYNKRYKYTGSFNFAFTNNITTDQIELPVKTKDFQLTWSHSPQSKGTGRFSASVSAATATFNNNNFLGVNSNFQSSRIDNMTQKLNSNINYSKTFAGTPFSLGVNLRHNQDLKTRQVDLPMPDVSFNMNNIYPFKRVENSLFLQNLNVRYTATGTNQITNNLGRIATDASGNPIDSIAPFTFENLPVFFRNARKGVRHNIPLSTSFKMLRFFTVSPSVTYDERWYYEKLNWRYNETDKRFEADTISQFNRVYNYQGGVSLNTRIYGTYLSKNPNARIRAVRHIINPSVSYSYQPDFSDPSFDYYQRFTVKDGVGRETTVLKARHEGFIYGTAGQGESSMISLGINNNIEMKVRGEKDTVDRKIPLFNTLSMGTSYNFLADSMNFSNVALSANTNILQDKINLNFNATLDPYAYRDVITGYDTQDKPILTEQRVNNLVWRSGQLGRITNANFAFGTNLSPKGKDKDASMREKISKSDISPAEKQYMLQNPDAYVDFSIPWNLRISYNIDYQHGVNQKPVITQAIRFNGDLSLTEKWKVTYNSGYDFQSKAFTQTQISINRDLHCWQMSLSWTPFGRFQSYNFSIGIKSALLRDLKLDRQRNFFDNTAN
jgi:hypothetical protein